VVDAGYASLDSEVRLSTISDVQNASASRHACPISLHPTDLSVGGKFGRMVSCLCAWYAPLSTHRLATDDSARQALWGGLNVPYGIPHNRLEVGGNEWMA
jgi:hypothetical protein